MSEFKMIKRAFPNLQVWRKPYKDDQFVVTAEELEEILQSAQVVYGVVTPFSQSGWGTSISNMDTHTAMVIGITPIKKKTKAEAALELLQEMLDDCLPMQGSEHDFAIEAKRILEMKDEV